MLRRTFRKTYSHLIVSAVSLMMALALIAGVGYWLLGEPNVHAQHPSAEPARSDPRLNRGLYSNAIVDSSGHLDVDGTVQEAVAAHADTYYYLIWDRRPRRTNALENPHADVSSDSWKKLPAFADRAAKYHIRTVVYLVPPSETDQATYSPYGWDYERWFTDIGQLSKAHRGIVAIAMDDLFANLTDARTPGLAKFNARRLGIMREDAKRYAPWIRFYAVLYGKDFFGATDALSKVRSAVDGVIYPFAGPDQLEGVSPNTVDASGLYSTTQQIRRATNCGGATQCLQARFEQQPGAHRTQTLIASASINGSSHKEKITVSFGDQRIRTVDSGYTLAIALDGKSVASTQGLIGKQTTLEADINPEATVRKHTLSIRVTRTVSAPGLTIHLDSVQVSDNARKLNLLTTSESAWTYKGSSGAAWSVVRPLQLIVMFYCTRFGAEGAKMGAADSAYIRALVPQMQRVIHDGLADGLVAYRLNSTGVRLSDIDGDPADLAVVRELFEGK